MPLKEVAKELIQLGERIRQRRKGYRLSQTQLAELSETSINFISQIEAGKPSAHIGKVYCVLEVLGLELEIKLRGHRE